MVFLVRCVTHLAALARGQMTSLLTCSLQWLIKVFVNEALWQRAWTSLWGKGCLCCPHSVPCKETGLDELLTFSERRNGNCRMSAASTWRPLRPWSRVG